MEENRMVHIEEREIHPIPGLPMLFGVILGFVLTIVGYIGCGFAFDAGIGALGAFLLIFGILADIGLIIACCGFHIVKPNEAIVLTLFGKYYGTILKEGFFFTNPFASVTNPCVEKEASVHAMTAQAGANGASISLVSPSKKVSTKVQTLNNGTQKVNDVLGNPIIIGSIVIWKVVNPTKAVFNVENYMNFLSIQCDSTIRNVARLYPYDDLDENQNDSIEEKTLRGSSQEIADVMKAELQKRVEEAGLEIQEVRITHLSYSEEIAAAMLQRQQAVAIIAARQKIVEGAVGMVKMAIDQLGEEEIVVLDEERKAAMVSNLLVVLCGNKDAQPIVNSGSIY